MADAHNYLVPEYYSGFSCKGGSCRSTCCHGWGIAFSMKEYFRLVGLACPPPIRRKLDSAVHLADHPTEDRYALITPNWLGDCPLYMENGLCQLHAECGEEVLSEVCRYYPRGIHTKFYRECSCANSCERTLEMLFDMEDVMRFEEKELSFSVSEEQGKPGAMAARYYKPIRKLVFGALQNRKYELPARLMLMGGMMRLLNEAFRNEEEWVISGALEVCAEMTPPEWERSDVQLIEWMYLLSRTFLDNVCVEEYIRKALGYLALSETEEPGKEELSEAAARYRSAAEQFEKRYPDWQRWFEQMMVNHVFFNGYPFSDRRERLWESHMALCAAYAFVRFLAVLCTEEKEGTEALIDVCAAVFRLIEHSPFDWNAVAQMEKADVQSAEDMARLALA